MGFRTEQRDSRQVISLGKKYLMVRHMFRIASENPDYALERADPELPVKEGALLKDLKLDYKESDGELVSATLANELAHNEFILIRAHDTSCQLRAIRRSWYSGSTTDAMIELTYESGRDEFSELRGKQKAIWEHDISMTGDTFLVAHKQGDPEGTFSLVPGGLQALVPVETMTAVLPGGYMTSTMAQAGGAINSKPFRGFLPGDVKFVGATGSVIVGSDVMDLGSSSDVVMTFMGKRQYFNGERVPGFVHMKPRSDELGEPTGDFDLYDEPSPVRDFKKLFPPGWDPGPFV